MLRGPAISVSRLIAFALLALGWIACAGAAEAREPRFALVIANGAYQNFDRLAATSEDGDKVAAALAAVGFVDATGAPVQARRDLTREAMVKAVADLQARLAASGPDAFGVVYFSGHGAALGSYGDVVMLPVDAVTDLGPDVRALSRATLTRTLVNSGGKTTLIVLDMCRSVLREPPAAASIAPIADAEAPDASAPDGAKGLRRLTRAGEPLKSGQGFLVAFSTSPDQVAFDTGEFSKVFAEEIRRPGQNIADALKRVSDRVALAPTASGAYQKPTFDYGLQGSAPCFVSCNPTEGGDRFFDCANCPYMRAVPPGEALLGSPANEPGRDADEPPPTLTRLPKPFALGVYTVTVAEWRACVRDKACAALPSWAKENPNPLIPATHISYRDAQAFLAWISVQSGRPYRLPTQAEWEYAARAGAATAFSFGDDITPGLANYDHTASYRKSPTAPYRGYPEAVNGYPANAFGLYQMQGNVWEWTDGCADASCRLHVVRGGSFSSAPRELRAANRFDLPPDKRRDDVGLRVARDLAADEAGG